MEEKALNLERAKLAEQVERYDDMKDAMKSIVDAGEPLTSEERNLLSVAYKNVCGAKRSAWNIANSIEQKSTSSEIQKKAVAEFKSKIKNELNNICDEVIGLIDKCLGHCDSGSDTSKEQETFFYKMKGDYYRYRVEVATETDIKEMLISNAKDAYNSATEASNSLPPTNPIRLGLALNFSVYHYEIEDKPETACEVARKAFDEAITELDSLKEDSYKDSTLIMQLLRDNITLWTSEQEPED
ncbi:14-3-3 protein beta/alpha-B-like [Anneissia japonica]|uniref:14-3-3 protein beta/alpha-B-like n=1 Tax=Anneissia japonica TaxID=1529436 RepID=UPI0014258882|nr:14-3-3 protein beta/alpha-B-like [Anneissia japonica]